MRELRMRMSAKDYEVLKQMANEQYVDVNTMVRILIRKEAKKLNLEIERSKDEPYECEH